MLGHSITKKLRQGIFWASGPVPVSPGASGGRKDLGSWQPSSLACAAMALLDGPLAHENHTAKFALGLLPFSQMGKRKKAESSDEVQPPNSSFVNWMIFVSVLVAVLAIIFAVAPYGRRPIQQKGPPPPIWENKNSVNEELPPDVKLSPEGLLLDSEGKVNTIRKWPHVDRRCLHKLIHGAVSQPIMPTMPDMSAIPPPEGNHIINVAASRSC